MPKVDDYTYLNNLYFAGKPIISIMNGITDWCGIFNKTNKIYYLIFKDLFNKFHTQLTKHHFVINLMYT